MHSVEFRISQKIVVKFLSDAFVPAGWFLIQITHIPLLEYAPSLNFNDHASNAPLKVGGEVRKRLILFHYRSFFVFPVSRSTCLTNLILVSKVENSLLQSLLSYLLSADVAL